MKKKYDIIIIGAGAGGLGVSIGMARLGFKVLLIDKNKDNFGGECLNSGCIPSKALIHVTNIIKKAKEAEKYGFTRQGKTDIEAVKRYVKKKQNIIRKRESVDFLEKEEGIDTLIGKASFVSRKEVEINGQAYAAKKILIAIGSRPRELKVKGIEKVRVFTNENLFDIDFLPETMLVIGGGPIGMEIGQCFARMETKVMVLEKENKIMSKELPEVSTLIQQRLEKDGIEFKLNHILKEFNSANTALLKNEKGEQIEVKCDAILIGIGRVKDYLSLNLKKAGVKMKDGKPQLDNYLRAIGNKNIVFAGDAAGNVMFSHGAELHTTILLTNFFTPWPFKRKLVLDNFSWCTFTDPEVCTFGYSEEQIKKKRTPYTKISYDFKEDDRATVSDYQYGKLILFLKKNIWNPRNGKILGGTVVAPAAGEMAQELIMANHKGLGASAIFHKTYPYPVQTRAHKMALVKEFSAGITKGIKKMLKFLYH